MRILEFEFEDRMTGWRLEQAHFNSFNLLVGISGVGKTRVLDAVRAVRGIVTTRRSLPNGITWRVVFEHEGVEYEWGGATEARELGDMEPGTMLRDDREEDEGPAIQSEFLKGSGDSPIFERDADRFVFSGKPLPRLKTTESAIRLLADERSVTPARKAFDRFVFEKKLFEQGSIISFRAEKLTRYEERFNSLEALQNAPDMPLELRAFLLQRLYPHAFEQIKHAFLEIFGSVQDLEVRRGPSEDLQRYYPEFPFWDADLVMLFLKEHGVPGWIPQFRFSSGMLRTIEMLIEVTLAPAGTVVLIDEFENSLGVNCMPQMTDFLLNRAADLQFIITSHHPYIIENIPVSAWKLVTRQGTTVHLEDATSFPELTSESGRGRPRGAAIHLNDALIS